MAASQVVSIRIPQELLEQLDSAAAQQYPLRNGDTPNRSKMILRFIQVGLELYPSSSDMSYNNRTATQAGSQTMLDDIEELIKQQVAQQVQIQLQIQQEVRKQMEQISEIAELRQEVAEVKKVLEVRTQQSELQISNWPGQDAQSDNCSELSEPETAIQSVIVESEQSTVLQPVLQSAPQQSESDWLTAKQAFQALGGNPDDRNSSVSSIDGSKQIRFSTGCGQK